MRKWLLFLIAFCACLFSTQAAQIEVSYHYIVGGSGRQYNHVAKINIIKSGNCAYSERYAYTDIKKTVTDRLNFYVDIRDNTVRVVPCGCYVVDDFKGLTYPIYLDNIRYFDDNRYLDVTDSPTSGSGYYEFDYIPKIYGFEFYYNLSYDYTEYVNGRKYQERSVDERRVLNDGEFVYDINWNPDFSDIVMIGSYGEHSGDRDYWSIRLNVYTEGGKIYATVKTGYTKGAHKVDLHVTSTKMQVNYSGKVYWLTRDGVTSDVTRYDVTETYTFSADL